jgi:CRISPR type III-A-associated protein Csm2
MVQKVCESCGRTFEAREDFHRYCPECFRERRAGRPTFRFDTDYLKDGYFLDTEREKLRPEILDTVAVDAAKALGSARPPMTSHQLRRFFNKMRAIEDKVDSGHDFGTVRADIYAFKRDVAYAVGRGVVSEQFKRFIDRNVELAVSDEGSFKKGFIQHFQSVLAYFVYYFRE